jgi:Uma2 family endonuclease
MAIDHLTREETQAVPAAPPARSVAAAPVPVLESGDHLSRAEFERRYEAMPELKKAELIEGVVYVASPVRITVHGKPHGRVITWLGVYDAATPGVELADNATVRLDLDNEPQPDALLRIDDAAGGQSRVDTDGYVSGAPELVVEVAASSAAIDRHKKLLAYRRNGVAEYVVWQVLDRRIEWFALQEGEYVELPLDERGVVHSRIFPGLRLAVESLLNGDLAAVLAEQQAALGTPDHRQFVATLTARLQPPSS